MISLSCLLAVSSVSLMIAYKFDPHPTPKLPMEGVRVWISGVRREGCGEDRSMWEEGMEAAGEKS